MDIDGRTVTRALAERTRPFLRDLGFSRFQGRNAWRLHEFTTDVIVFPSMNRYIADGVGCTPFSFGGEVGVYYRAGDEEEGWWPRSYDATFRGSLGKTMRQPIFHPWGRKESSDRADVWFVLEDGSNLEDVADDVVSTLRDQAIPFIERLGDPKRALVSLDTEPGSDPDFGKSGLSEGALGCPNRLEKAALIRPLVG